MGSKIAIYGKGGSGKSTIAAALSSCFAQKGKRVIHIGCDPKADSSRLLVPSGKIVSVMGIASRTDLFDEQSLLMKGIRSICCVESGGPEPGIGCAGRGISRTFEILEEQGVSVDDYDVAMFDVLGDVVCGGFATPLKAGFAEQVVVVASGSSMSLFAANNILKAVCRFQRNGIKLAGLVGNYLTGDPRHKRMERFAQLTNTRVLAHIDQDLLVQEAEQSRQTIYDYCSDGPTFEAIGQIATTLAANEQTQKPKPLDEATFDGLLSETLHE